MKNKVSWSFTIQGPIKRIGWGGDIGLNSHFATAETCNKIEKLRALAPDR